jgi:kynurenine formamidase
LSRKLQPQRKTAMRSSAIASLLLLALTSNQALGQGQAVLPAPIVQAKGAPTGPAAHKAAPPRPGSLLGPEALLQQSTEPLLRETAAQVLGARGQAEAVPLLAKALSDDTNLWVRARSAEALGKIGSSAGISALRTALSKERDQRARRMIASALVRLGQNAGVQDLLWQLKTGTNNTKAEVMDFLVEATGQPLGQDVEAWWTYLDAQGSIFLARRPAGSPAIFELRGMRPDGHPRADPPAVYAQKLPPWHQVSAVVLTFPAVRAPLTLERLRSWEKAHGVIPDHCLLLLQTRWFEAQAQFVLAKQQEQQRREELKTKGQRVPATRPRPGASEGKPEPTGPGLELDALHYLLQKAPNLVGVGIDVPAIDLAEAAEHPLRNELVSRGRWALEGMSDLERLHPHGTRLLILNAGAGATPGAQLIHLLAILP